MTKFTKRDAFNEILGLAGLSDDARTIIEKELAAIDRKNEKAKERRANGEKPDKNADLKGKIREVLAAAAEPMTAKAIGEKLGTSTNKVSGVLRTMDDVDGVAPKKNAAQVYSLITAEE